MLMQCYTVGILHPGEMGTSVAAALRARGHRVLWCAAGRSAQTASRARDARLERCEHLGELLGRADAVVSVCPPHAAEAMAAAVAAHAFAGLFVDANAIAAATASRIAERVSAAGARYVDGGIIGPPVRAAGTTRLYLSGADALQAARLFEGSELETIVVDGPPFAASALKVCYAAWTKGSNALLACIRALAARDGVDAALLGEWQRSQPGLEERSRRGVCDNAFKAWRWIDEMEQIADSFERAELPAGFHRAAADTYRRLDRFKDCRSAPALDQIVSALTRAGG